MVEFFPGRLHRVLTCLNIPKAFIPSQLNVAPPYCSRQDSVPLLESLVGLNQLRLVLLCSGLAAHPLVDSSHWFLSLVWSKPLLMDLTNLCSSSGQSPLFRLSPPQARQELNP